MSEHDERRHAQPPPRHFWTLLLLSFAVVVALVVLPEYVFDDGGTPVEVPPDELTGTWTTDDPRYAGRFIRIGPERLTLGLGESGQESYPIRAIQAETAAVHRQYEIRYAGTEDAEEVLEVFVYDDGLMRLRNPSEVQWRRRTD